MINTNSDYAKCKKIVLIVSIVLFMLIFWTAFCLADSPYMANYNFYSGANGFVNFSVEKDYSFQGISYVFETPGREQSFEMVLNYSNLSVIRQFESRLMGYGLLNVLDSVAYLQYQAKFNSSFKGSLSEDVDGAVLSFIATLDQEFFEDSFYFEQPEIEYIYVELGDAFNITSTDGSSHLQGSFGDLNVGAFQNFSLAEQDDLYYLIEDSLTEKEIKFEYGDFKSTVKRFQAIFRPSYLVDQNFSDFKKGFDKNALADLNETIDSNNTFDVQIALGNLSISNITFENLLVINDTINLGIEDIPLDLDSRFDSVQSYAIDPEALNFTTASFTVEAKGTSLYKCPSWNFSSQECMSDDWTFVMTITPGESYSYDLYPKDPAFIEIIEISKASHLNSEGIFLENIYDSVKADDSIWSPKIYSNEFIQVTFEDALNYGNDITVVTRNPEGLNTGISVYLPDGTFVMDFPIIAESKTLYKEFLPYLSNDSYVFDLKVISYDDVQTYLEFDFIVDPSFGSGGGKTLANISNISIYDVTNLNKTNSSNLVGSGLNSSYSLVGNHSYRVEFNVTNDGSDWNISDLDILYQEGLNSSWVVDAVNNIWYEDGNGTVYSGGSFASGIVTWNLSNSSFVKSDEFAMFYCVVNVSSIIFKNYSMYFFVNDTSDAAGSYDNFSLLVSPATWPDLVVNGVEFNPLDVIEGEPLTVYVNLTNTGFDNATNFSLNLSILQWNGSVWIYNSSQVKSNLELNESDSLKESFTWTAVPGTWNFVADVDFLHNVTELVETNNENESSYDVGAWATIYGGYNVSKLIVNNNHNVFYEWDIQMSSANLFFSDSDSVYWPSDLVVFDETNDFNDTDSSLGMSAFVDSIQGLFDVNNNGIADDTSGFTISGVDINNVPVIDSTNNSNFLTGILYDSSDGTPFDGSQDVVFVTEINFESLGKYGTYDYEIRLPSRLGLFKGSSSFVTRMGEVN